MQNIESEVNKYEKNVSIDKAIGPPLQEIELRVKNMSLWSDEAIVIGKKAIQLEY